MKCLAVCLSTVAIIVNSTSARALETANPKANAKTGHWPAMIGLDAYTDNVDRKTIKGHEELAAIQKPFGFTEYGPHGSANPPGILRAGNRATDLVEPESPSSFPPVPTPATRSPS